MKKALIICMAAILGSTCARAAEPDVCSSMCAVDEKKCRREAAARAATDANPPVTWSSSGRSGRHIPQEISGQHQVNVDDLKRERYERCRDAYRLCIRDCGRELPSR